MKKFLGIVVLGVFLFSCSEQNSTRKRVCKNEYKYEEKSIAYKNCIKDDDHFFAYGIKHKSKEIFERNQKLENLYKTINKKKVNIDHKSYTNISYKSFVKENFQEFSMRPKKGKQISDKKYKFLSKVSILAPDEEDNQYAISVGGALLSPHARFHNIDIQNKITSGGPFSLYFTSPIPMASTVHVVYGSFKPSTDILGQVYTFYVEDIIFTETDTKIDFIIERMIYAYCKRNNKNIENITEIYNSSLK